MNEKNACITTITTNTNLNNHMNKILMVNNNNRPI